MSRALVAVAASVALHTALAALAVGVSLWRGLPLLPKARLELVKLDVKEVTELPLGPPPPPKSASGGEARSRPRRVAKTKSPGAVEGALLSRQDGGADAGAPPGDAGAGDAGAGRGDARGLGDGGPPRPRDLRPYGPENSRLTALLRLDRLRASPDRDATIAAVDNLLKVLPDRRRLVEGSGIDLYRDMDALLIATPNPIDDTVTFLAARHRLTDEAIMAALSRGGEAAGRPLEWTTEGGRPVGLKRTRGGKPGAAGADRDERIILLVAPGLAVIAPPAYAALLLPETAAKLGRSRPDAGAAAGGATPAQARAAVWRELITRLDAQGGAMPEEAVLMMTAVNLWRKRDAEPSTAAAPRAAPAPDDDVPQLIVGGDLPVPNVVNVFAGTTPTPFLEIECQMETESEASVWERRFPGFKQRLLGNPIVLLSGWTSILARANLRREAETVTLRTTSSQEEMRRVLNTIANLIVSNRPNR